MSSVFIKLTFSSLKRGILPTCSVYRRFLLLVEIQNLWSRNFIVLAKQNLILFPYNNIVIRGSIRKTAIRIDIMCCIEPEASGFTYQFPVRDKNHFIAIYKYNLQILIFQIFERKTKAQKQNINGYNDINLRLKKNFLITYSDDLFIL